MAHQQYTNHGAVKQASLADQKFENLIAMVVVMAMMAVVSGSGGDDCVANGIADGL